MGTAKDDVRKGALKERRSMPPERIGALSEMIRRNVEALDEYRKARTIASYVSKSGEIDTRKLLNAALKEGKRVLVPRSDPRSGALIFHEISSLGQLKTGHFGVLEPPAGAKSVPLGESELLLVPMLAADLSGDRVGYGKGYFDRALRHKGDAVSVGLVTESQLHKKLPTEESDVPLDIIVTERRVLRL